MLTIVTIYLEHSLDLVKSASYAFILIKAVLNKYLINTTVFFVCFLRNNFYSARTH